MAVGKANEHWGGRAGSRASACARPVDRRHISSYHLDPHVSAVSSIPGILISPDSVSLRLQRQQ